MSLATHQRLLGHMRWADEKVLEALRQAPGDHARRALELYAHILGAESVWLSRLQSGRATVAVWPDLSLAECEELARENQSRYDAWLAGFQESDLDRQVSYVNSAGQPFRSTVEEILLQVWLHGTYHRGQVALLIRDGGGTPAPTDFIAFARGAPAATRMG